MSSDNVLTPKSEWDLIIKPQRGWFDLRLDQLWRARELIMMFVWRDFVSVYKQTILGPMWYIIQPLLTTLMFTIVFGKIAHLSTDGLPPFLFYLSGNTVWTYFSTCLTSTSNTFTSNAAIFGKVYFPRLSVPISIVVSNLISFTIRFFVFLVFLIYFWWVGAQIQITLWVLLLPVLLLIMGGLGLGFGILVSSLTTKYRDLQHLVAFGVQLLMYTTPVIYPLSSVPGVWRWLLLANPMTAVVEMFRLSFLGKSSVEPIYLLYSAIFALAVFLSGVLVFNHVEATFMDTV